LWDKEKFLPDFSENIFNKSGGMLNFWSSEGNMQVSGAGFS